MSVDGCAASEPIDGWLMGTAGALSCKSPSTDRRGERHEVRRKPCTELFEIHLAAQNAEVVQAERDVLGSEVEAHGACLIARDDWKHEVGSSSATEREGAPRACEEERGGLVLLVSSSELMGFAQRVREHGDVEARSRRVSA